MRKIFTYLLLIFSFPLIAQEVGTDIDLNGQVRKLAAEQKFSEAKQITKHALQMYPENSDIQVLLSRIYAWESHYDSAFYLLVPLLELHPDHADAAMLKADILYWKNDWTALNEYAKAQILNNPDQASLLYYQALSLYQLGSRQEAERILNDILDEDPEHHRANALKRQMLLNSSSPEIFTQYHFDHFTEPYNRKWHMLTVGGVIPFSKWTISPSINSGYLKDGAPEFINSSALQFNVDAYLLLSEKNYLLAGYGISNGTYFPVHRGVLNIWQLLSEGWAVNAGARYFYWDQHFTFLTFGVEKYLGKYWINLNNSLFFKEYGVSASSYLSVRRYMEHKYNYISATIGYGTSPDEPLTSIGDLQRLNALSLRLFFSRQVQQKIRISIGGGYMFEEYGEGVHRNRYDATLGLSYKID